MAKSINVNAVDALLDEIALGNRLDVCTAEPTTRTEAVTTFTLGNVSLTPGAGNGDFTISSGSGVRTLSITAQEIASASGTGDATHIAITDASRLLLVTSVTGQSISTGNQINVSAFDLDVEDPT